MPGIRFAIIGVALAGAALFQSVHAAPSVPPVAPPAEFAKYIAQVKAAESVQGDEARCKATPDLPGNQWRSGAAQGRCAMLRAPALTLDKIDSLLATPAGVAALESRFASLLKAHYRDPAQRDQIFIAYQVFDESPRAGEIAQRWLKLSPKSAFARVAVGVHFSGAGWKARGTRVASSTSEDKFERMSGYFAQAVPMYKQALEIEPRLSIACTRLNSIGRQSSNELQALATAHCLKVDPDSYWVEREQIRAADPMWSGSTDALYRAVAFARTRADRNPTLGVFLGEGVGYKASKEDSYGEVVDTLVVASRIGGPNPAMMYRAGSGYWDIRQHWLALVYYSQVVRFEPDNTFYRYARAGLLAGHLKDYAWAKSDMELALQKEPDNARFLLQMGDIALATESAAAARAYYTRGAKGESREDGKTRYCETYLEPTVTKEAQACTRDLVREFARSANAWYTHARALADHDVKGALAALEQVRVVADPDERADRRAVARAKRLEDQLKARTSPSAARAAGK